MRRIKFRAWSTTSKKFYYRVLVGNTENDDPCSSIWNEDEETWKEFDKFCGTIQQFTGLKDSKGVDIYEGDLLEFAYTDNKKFVGKVEYEEKFACFVVATGNAFETFSDLADYTSSFKVVGNIFENET
jgi:uncharacterized phage protein (TIGR01671 family)